MLRKRGKRTRLFFVTDVHGSDMCFRKFLSAIKIYDADVGILLGDLAGKMVVPIIRNSDGTATCTFLGIKNELKTDDDVSDQIKKIRDIGFYPYETTQDGYDALQGQTEKIDVIFYRLMEERLKQWIGLADEKLKDSKAQVFIAPGNDDPVDLDTVLDSSKTMISCHDRKVMVGDEYEMITISHATPTPWDTPRECGEEELATMIEKLTSQIKNMESAIFNFHAPPKGTMLDYAPRLSEDIRQSAGEMVHVGSQAVADAIKKYQPFLGLHGHIHESRGFQHIGRTAIANPGSEYSEGILRGVIFTLEGTSVKNYQFTSG